MQTWVDSLSYPITVRNFRNSLFTNLGITQETRTLINDGLTISGNFKSFMNAPSATDLMRWICQLNAVYGQYGRDGIFHYRELNPLSEGLYPSETTYPGETTYPSAENAGTTITSSDYTSLRYEPYTTDYITKVAIMDDSGIDQGQAGVDGNTFTIQDNPLAFNVNMRTAASAILAKVYGINHIPVVEMKCVGMPYLECGDTYLSYTRRFVCRTYILQRTLSGIQALFDEYSSDCDKDYPPYKATAQTSINADRKSILDIQADIVNFKTLTAQNFEATNGRVSTLETDDISFKNSITSINGSIKTINGDIKTINGSITTMQGDISTAEGDITTLNGTVSGLRGDFDTLNSKAITTDNLSAQKIDGSQINAGTISANEIHAGTITADRMNVDLSGSGDDQSSWGLTLGQYGSSFSVGKIGSNRVNNSYVNGYYTQWQRIRVIGSIDHTYIWQNAQKTIRISDTQPDSSWTRVGEVAETVHGKTIYTIAQDNMP